jgi:hypothetical protein
MKNSIEFDDRSNMFGNKSPYNMNPSPNYTNNKSQEKDYSRSPIQEVDAIKGSLENQMTEDQIVNKRAFVWSFGKN